MDQWLSSYCKSENGDVKVFSTSAELEDMSALLRSVCFTKFGLRTLQPLSSLNHDVSW
jgi:hypothetical protein